MLYVGNWEENGYLSNGIEVEKVNHEGILTRGLFLFYVRIVQKSAITKSYDNRLCVLVSQDV